MFTPADASYLLRAINRNIAAVFLGAGFSSEASNKLGSRLPLGKDLASDIWDLLGFSGSYDDSPLSDLYQALLASGRPFPQIQSFLEDRLLCAHVPDEYDALVLPAWYRIYTTNADNLLDIVWRRSAMSKLDVLAFPHDDVRERDQLLDKFQAIYLHGKLPCRPDELTFATRQYAKRALRHDPLYDQFVRDYATHPFVFLGTELSEPLFWQYLEARDNRGTASSEHRPKSFLVAKRISQAKKAILESLNVTPIQADVSEFLRWIAENRSKVSDAGEVLKETLPTYIELASSISVPSRRKDVGEFARAFHSVPITVSGGQAYRSNFLLGTTPKWEDILNGLDAPRTITTQLVHTISQLHATDPRIQVIAILGSAGSGKSTLLRRLGLTLAQTGQRVLLSNSEELPRPGVIAKAVDEIPGRLILLFDNAEGALGLLPSLVRELKGTQYPPILVVAARTNDFDRRVGRFGDLSSVKEFHVPNLDELEIRAVLDVLDRNHLLGKLRGLSQEDRVREFRIRAKRQILIAMREATTGRGFDEILVDEFETLPSDEARVLYLCAALATDAGYRIRKDELVGCSSVKPAEATYLIERSLRDIVLPTGPTGDLLLLRHRYIAEFMVDGAASRDLLAIAYIRLLRVLSGQLGDRSWRARPFAFYRQLVNHLGIYRRFPDDIGAGRDIYESLRTHLANDPHFWLQYGSLELEADVLDRAENYLAQASSLDPSDWFIKNAMGHLLLRKSLAATSKAQALELRTRGSEIVLVLLSEPETASVHGYHIYCSQRFAWIRKWGSSPAEIREELESLRNIMSTARERFPRARELQQLQVDIERDYLRQAMADQG